MEIIYFLILIGVCAFAVVWAMRRSKTETDLVSKRFPTKAEPPNDLLTTPGDTPFAHKNELWATRRKHATKGFSNSKRFVPRSEAAQESKYDGYSRRDRHHLTATGQVKEEAHNDEHEEPKMTSTDFDPNEHASQT